MFNPTRLSLARRRRGLTKKRLADLTGLTPQSITNYESGTREPENIEILADALQFPSEFFFGDDIEELANGQASFRALSRMTASQRDAAQAAGALATRLAAWMDERFILPAPAIPDLKDSGDAEAAARELRTLWRIGERPVSNMVHLLESHGARVFSLAEECREVDAFSYWFRGVPYVFLNTMKSSERSRFDAGHELGHLVLHQHGGARSRAAEDQANAFASAFLMPISSTRSLSSTNATLESILAGKLAWGVSAMAYAYRLFKVGMLTDWYYHELVVKMSALGYRASEPNSRPRETSQVFSKVLEQLRADHFTKRDVAKDLRVYAEEIDRMLFGLTMTGINGSASSRARNRPHHNMRLVKG